VLILDALDQAGDAKQLLHDLCDAEFKEARVIFTGRLFAFNVDQQNTLFAKDRNCFATILPFSKSQQVRAFKDLTPPVRDLDAVFERYDDVHQLLGVAGMLAMAHDVAREEWSRSGGREKVKGLRTRADFYWRYFERLTRQAALAVSGQGVDPKRLPLYERMLAAAAFRMVLQGAVNVSVAGVVLERMKSDVAAYCGAQKHPIDESAWTELKAFSALSDHGLIEARDEPLLSWRHRGWMEFFAGLFLARYAEPAALAQFDFLNMAPSLPQRDEPGFRGFDDGQPADSEVLFKAVLAQLTNDRRWEWVWRFATQIPRIDPMPPIERRSLCRSLAALYRLPERGRRPTRLMYEAFYLFETDDLTPPDLARFAKTLTPTQRKEVMDEFRASGGKLPESSAPVARVLGGLVHPRTGAEFAPCPPPGWRHPTEPGRDPCVYWQGKEGGWDNNRRLVRIRPFHMQTTTVTHGQHVRFDPGIGKGTEAGWEVLPVVEVDWWDSWCYSKWLGPEYRLPTEAEWEFACRAGKDGPEDHFAFGKTLSGEQANYDGSHPDDYRAPGWNKSRDCLVPADGSIPHGNLNETFLPNRFGLYHMHGNVWEWCCDWHGDYEPAVRAGVPIDRPDRGGSWGSQAAYCRSASRYRDSPGPRYDDLGFRPARVQSG
jgi:formylglycine-generating enzyme required for sulfatase activity